MFSRVLLGHQLDPVKTERRAPGKATVSFPAALRLRAQPVLPVRPVLARGLLDGDRARAAGGRCTPARTAPRAALPPGPGQEACFSEDWKRKDFERSGR